MTHRNECFNVGDKNAGVWNSSHSGMSLVNFSYAQLASRPEIGVSSSPTSEHPSAYNDAVFFPSLKQGQVKSLVIQRQLTMSLSLDEDSHPLGEYSSQPTVLIQPASCPMRV